MDALCKLKLEAPDPVTKILPAANGQKMNDFEPVPQLERYSRGVAKFLSGKAKKCCLFLQYEHAGP